MKKVLGIFALFLVLTALQSCRSKEKCPAYGQVETTTNPQNKA
jgi:hypothetical protein